MTPRRTRRCWSSPSSPTAGWTRLGHRAIGVMYHPELEAAGNYVPSVLARRYDALCYGDRTTALQPLHREPPQPAAVQGASPFGG